MICCLKGRQGRGRDHRSRKVLKRKRVRKKKGTMKRGAEGKGTAGWKMKDNRKKKRKGRIGREDWKESA